MVAATFGRKLKAQASNDVPVSGATITRASNRLRQRNSPVRRGGDTTVTEPALTAPTAESPWA